VAVDRSIRPAGAPFRVAASGFMRRAADDAVATDLSASQSVTAADAAARTQLDPRRSGAGLSPQVILDPEAVSVVYGIEHDGAKPAIDPPPEDTMRRQHAYDHSLESVKAERASGAATDRKV
jgi:hypothetical protein